MSRWIGQIPAVYTLTFVGLLLSAGGIILALGQLLLGSALISLAAIWLATWFCTLKFKRHLPRHIWPIRVAGVIVIAVVFTSIPVAAYLYTEEQRLKSPKGYLEPDNLAAPNNPCFEELADSNTFRVQLGSESFVVADFHRIDFSVAGKPLFWIEAQSEGGIALSADIRNPENKIVVAIDRNWFSVNQNTILDFDRENRSKLVIRDEYGDEIFIHYLNSTTVAITGVFKVGATRIVVKQDRTVVRTPDIYDGIIAGACYISEGRYTHNLDWQ